MDVTQNARMGPFEVIERLGRGGFTEVLLAKDLRHKSYGTLVAIKRLRRGLIQRDPVFLESLLYEAELGMLVNNPHVVRVDCVFEADGEPALVMEYVEGYTLDHLMKLADGRGLPPEVAAEIIRQLCEGLAAIHEANDADGVPLCTVHQDIKPANVLMTRGGLVKVLDFNLARSQRGDRPPLWVRQGTPGYRSPEQARGEWLLTPASDLYSVGVVLYELLTGKRLFDGVARNPERLLARQQQVSLTMEIVALRMAPPGLDTILQRLLAFEPERRFRSATELVETLGPWQKAWNPRFELKEFLFKRRNVLEALASRPVDDSGIHRIDTEQGELLTPAAVSGLGQGLGEHSSPTRQSSEGYGGASPQAIPVRTSNPSLLSSHDVPLPSGAEVNAVLARTFDGPARPLPARFAPPAVESPNRGGSSWSPRQLFRRISAARTER